MTWPTHNSHMHLLAALSDLPGEWFYRRPTPALVELSAAGLVEECAQVQWGDPCVKRWRASPSAAEALRLWRAGEPVVSGVGVPGSLPGDK